MEALFGILVLVLALAGLVIVLVKLVRRFRPRTSPAEPDPLATLPNLEDLSVSGDTVRVTFAAPMVGDDPILSELLSYHALEAVRRARRNLPLEGLKGVEVFASHRDRTRKVGSVDFDEPGHLPETMPVPDIVKVSEVMGDPLDDVFGTPKVSKKSVGDHGGETLAPLGSFLRISAKAGAALRMQGIDPDDMTAGELVRGILALRGYTVTAAPDADTHHARKGSATVFFREVPHSRGEHPELSEREINRFAMDMVASRMARGMLVTEKYGPFLVYKLERRNPRIRFVTRERLQKAIDALALG